jgi:hypothetical protein
MSLFDFRIYAYFRPNTLSRQPHSHYHLQNAHTITLYITAAFIAHDNFTKIIWKFDTYYFISLIYC